MHSESYNQPTPPGELSLPLVVDRGYLQKILDVLRPTSKPMPCWWCRRPLTGPTCPTCDEGAL